MHIGMIGILVAVLLAACGGSTDDYRLFVEVRASVHAPADAGIEPGGLIPNAELEVFGADESTRLVVALTDEDGAATIAILGPGRYSLWASAETSEPHCNWGQKLVVTFEEESTTVRFDDMSFACAAPAE